MATSTEKLEAALGLSDEFGGVNPDPTFEVMPVPVKKTNVPVISSEQVEKNKAEDYDYARETMTHLMAQGSEALMGILTLAAEGPNARTYEVVATLIKTVSDVSKDLISLDHKMTPDESPGTQKAQHITNNQYNMSQADAVAAAKLVNEPVNDAE